MRLTLFNAKNIAPAFRDVCLSSKYACMQAFIGLCVQTLHLVFDSLSRNRRFPNAACDSQYATLSVATTNSALKTFWKGLTKACFWPLSTISRVSWTTISCASAYMYSTKPGDNTAICWLACQNCDNVFETKLLACWLAGNALVTRLLANMPLRPLYLTHMVTG